jgi:hypothetical protein
MSICLIFLSIMPLTAQDSSKLKDIIEELQDDFKAMESEFESGLTGKPSDEALKFAKLYENKRISNDTRMFVNMYGDTVYYGKFILNIYRSGIDIEVAAKNTEDAYSILKTHCPPNKSIPEGVYFRIYLPDGSILTRDTYEDYLDEY